MAKLQTCCCGCSLRTGALIIASIDVVFACIFLSLCTWVAVSSTSDWVIIAGFGVPISIYLARFLSLLIGAKKSRPKGVLAWLIFCSISIFVNVVSAGIIIASLSSIDAFTGFLAIANAVFVIVLVLVIFIIILDIFFWVTVYRFYRDLSTTYEMA